jgi:transcriptional regulator with XRE-family HTH domain
MSRLTEILAKARSSVVYLTESVILDFTYDIERFMESRKLSRADLAKKVGVSPAYITKVLRGEGNLTVKSVVSLADAVGAKVVLQLVDKESVIEDIEWLSVGTAYRPQMIVTTAANESIEPCPQAA